MSLTATVVAVSRVRVKPSGKHSQGSGDARYFSQPDLLLLLLFFHCEVFMNFKYGLLGFFHSTFN